MPSEYSPEFQAVIDYIESKNFTYTLHPEEQRLTLNLSGKNSNLHFDARISHDDAYLQLTATYPFKVRDEKLRPSTAELITRANYCMPLGKFEMDMKDGEVRFHISHVIGELGLTEAMIEKQFMTAYFTADRYFPAFMQHIHAGYTPEDAVFHAELDSHVESVKETPNPARKEKPKANPNSSSKTAAPRPTKKQHRKKSGGGGGSESTGQGELPI